MFIKVITKGTVRYISETDTDFLQQLNKAGGYEVEGDEEGKAIRYSAEEVYRILNPESKRTSVESILDIKPKKSVKSSKSSTSRKKR